MRPAPRDLVLHGVTIRFRLDSGRVETRCTVTARGSDVRIDLDADVPGVPLRILGRAAGRSLYHGLAWGPDGAVRPARWADVGSLQVGIVFGDDDECLFVVEAGVPRNRRRTVAGARLRLVVPPPA